MTNYKFLIDSLSIEQIIKLMSALGSSNYKIDTNGNYIFRSVCHDSNSYKLYYFPQTKNFFCYKEWKNFNVFSLIMQVRKVEFADAYSFLCSVLDINTNSFSLRGGFQGKIQYDDWDFFNKYLHEEIPSVQKEDRILNDSIIEVYNNLYYQGWIDEHIAIEAMKKFNIRYDIVNERIIIPHYNIDNQLIGIRCRNLSKEATAKYCPIMVQVMGEKYLLNHNLSQHLYGFNFNKDTIRNINKCFLVESEKAVLQCESYFPNHNFSLACCGSNISNAQIQLLLQNKVSKVILGFDFDYEEYGDENYKRWKRNVLLKAKQLIKYFDVYALHDLPERIFGYKDSPTDRGKEALITIMQNKIKITEQMLEEELAKEN